MYKGNDIRNDTSWASVINENTVTVVTCTYVKLLDNRQQFTKY